MSQQPDKPLSDQWRQKAQPGEKAFHLGNKWRASSAFMADTARLFEAFGFKADDFAGQLVVDAGAGSRLRSRFFAKARLAAIEPLANDFIREIPWCDLDQAQYLYSEPAEKMMEPLCGQAAMVMCINVLDHTYDPQSILDNIRAYLRLDGVFLLSVDLHAGADEMHPVALTRQALSEMLAKAGFEPARAYEGLPNSPYYGHGLAWTLVLRPSEGGPWPADAVRPVRLKGSRWAWAYRLVFGVARTIKRLLKPGA
jgi:2-polyprenyl-3-methyl-5-hydroxy-6-metoxy-1,4-benzoquinol methylase